HRRLDPRRARDVGRPPRYDVPCQGLREGVAEGAPVARIQAGLILRMGGHEGASRRPARKARRRNGPHVMSTERRIGRGLFLATVAGGVSSLAWGKSVWSHVSKAVGPVESLVPLVPTGGWRIYTVSGSMPTFDRATWRLDVGGLVEKPVALTYAHLRALPRAEQVSTFHCVTGWTVKNVHWGGVRITDVFDLVRPVPEASALQFVSAEKPYVDYLSINQVRLHDVMLAYEMNGK